MAKKKNAPSTAFSRIGVATKAAVQETEKEAEKNKYGSKSNTKDTKSNDEKTSKEAPSTAFSRTGVATKVAVQETEKVANNRAMVMDKIKAEEAAKKSSEKASTPVYESNPLTEPLMKPQSQYQYAKMPKSPSFQSAENQSQQSLDKDKEFASSIVTDAAGSYQKYGYGADFRNDLITRDEHVYSSRDSKLSDREKNIASNVTRSLVTESYLNEIKDNPTLENYNNFVTFLQDNPYASDTFSGVDSLAVATELMYQNNPDFSYDDDAYAKKVFGQEESEIGILREKSKNTKGDEKVKIDNEISQRESILYWQKTYYENAKKDDFNEFNHYVRGVTPVFAGDPRWGYDPTNELYVTKEEKDYWNEKYPYIDTDMAASKGYTPEMAQMLFYIANTQGLDAASEFRDKMMPITSVSAGEYTYNLVKDIPVVKQVVGVTQGLIGGGATAVQKTANAFASFGGTTYNTDNLYTGLQPFIENSSGIEKGLYQASGAIGEMSPSIGISALNPFAGTVLFATQAYGGGYAEAKSKGYDDSSAKAFGVGIAALEVVTEKIGGWAFGKVGKIKFFNKAATKIDDVFKTSPKLRAMAATSVKLAENGLGELTEEYVSAVFTPVLGNFILGEDNEVKIVSKENLEESLVGGFTGLILGSPTAVTSIAKTFKPGNYGANIVFWTNASDSIIESEMLKGNPDAFKGLSGQAKDDAITEFKKQKFIEVGYDTIFGHICKGIVEGKSLDQVKKDIAKEGIDVGDYFTPEEFSSAYDTAKFTVSNTSNDTQSDVLMRSASTLYQNAPTIEISPENVLSVVDGYIGENRSTAEIVDIVVESGAIESPAEARELVLNKKDAAFINSLPSGMTSTQKAQAISDYVASESALDNQYFTRKQAKNNDFSISDVDLSTTENQSEVSKQPIPKPSLTIDSATSSITENVKNDFKALTNSRIPSAQISEVISSALTEESSSESITRNLADLFVSSLEQKNSTVLSILESGTSDRTVAVDALVEYTMNGNVSVGDSKKITKIAQSFKDIVDSTLININFARKALSQVNSMADTETDTSSDNTIISDVSASAQENIPETVTPAVSREKSRTTELREIAEASDEANRIVDEAYSDFLRKYGIEDNAKDSVSSDVDGVVSSLTDEDYNRADSIIASFGSAGKRVFNRIMNSIGNGASSTAKNKYKVALTYLYDKGLNKASFDRSKVSMIDDINLMDMYNAGVDDAIESQKVMKKAEVIPETVSNKENVDTEKTVAEAMQNDINNLGSKGKSVFKSIMADVIERDGATRKGINEAIEQFNYIYHTIKNGKEIDPSKVSKFTEDEIKRISDAAKADSNTVAVSKKSNARLIKNAAFTKAKISKREERMLSALAKITGRDIIFSETLKSNAKINLSTGVIEISVNAKNGTRWACIHEVFHALKVDYPAEANALIRTVMSIIGKNKDNLAKTLSLFENVYADEIYDENGNLKEGALDYIEEEIAADMIGYVLSKGDILESITGEERSVLQKFIDKLTDYFSEDKLEKAIAPELRQAYRDLYKEVDTIAKQFKEVFDMESKETKNTVSEDGGTVDAKDSIRHSYSSIANTFFGDENMTSVDFIKKNYKDTEGYKNYVEKCLDNMRQSRENFDENTAKEEIEKQIDGIVRVALASKKAGYDIADNKSKRDVKDSKSRLLFSSLEPNSDYFTSSDISTICDKRKNFAEIYDEIVRIEEEKGVPEDKRFFSNVDNYFVIHKIMADMGLTQPCRQCYVESMRKNLAPMANAFLKLVNETDAGNKSNDQLYSQSGKTKGELKSNNAKLRENVLKTFDEHPEYDMTVSDLTVETLTTEEGLALLKIKAPLIYEAFNSFYGQSKPKMPKAATPFRFGELTALLTDNNGKINQRLVDKINSTGGFRLQSYSNFQIQNYVDVLQVLFEAGTLGLNGHAYTKVPAFLEATDNTNLKRNISIFMYKDEGQWKLDKNDSFPYDLEEIYKIVEADKSGNTGIIAVSQNKDMSCWIMANDMIGYGIPFHKSGLKMGVVRDTDVKTEDGRVIKGYAGTIDHTKQQTEVWAKTTDGHKALTKVSNGINIYSFWDFDNKSNLSKKELIEKNLKRYIDECEQAEYLPKFRDYVMNNGAVLSSVLSYAKELGYASKDAAVEDISFNYKGYTIPYGYYKFLGDFSMFTPDGKASAQKVLSLENYDFDKAVDFFSDAESLRRNEILQQFANGEERAKYRDSKLSAEELEKIVDKKRKDIAKEVTETRKSKDLSGQENDYTKTVDRSKSQMYNDNTKTKPLIESKEKNNENKRKQSLFGIRWSDLFRSREQSERIFGNAGKERQESYEQRKKRTDRIRRNGRFVRRVIDGATANVILRAEYNSDMKQIYEFNKKLGINTIFTIDDIVTSSGVSVAGLVNGNGKMFISYSAETSPFIISRHESCHWMYDTAALQRIKTIIYNKMPKKLREKLYYSERYRPYWGHYNGVEADVFEEIVCDIMSGAVSSKLSYPFGKLVNAYWNKDFDVIRNFSKEDFITFEQYERGERYYNLQKQWYPDLHPDELNALSKAIKKDILTSTNSITDTANWMFTHIGDLPVFAIYSTVDTENPTLLYESKKDKAEFENQLIKKILEEKKDGKHSDGKSGVISRVLKSSWVSKSGGIIDDNGTVGRGSNNRNAGVLQNSSSSRPDAAFESVIRNLFEIQEKSSGITKKSKDLSGESELFDDDRTMTSYEIQRENSKLLSEFLKERSLERWGINLDRIDDAPRMSVDEAVKKVAESFGLNIIHGGDASVSDENVASSYNIDTKTIRTKIKNDLPSIVHALGYHVDNSLNIIDDVIEQTAKVRDINGNGTGELESELLILSNPTISESRKRLLDGFAEFMRLYFVSKPMAEERAPIFYSYFESKLKTDDELSKAINDSATTISNYFALSVEGRGSSAIMTEKEWKKLNRPKGKEAIRLFWNDKVIKPMLDKFYGIKAVEKEQGVFDLSTSDSAYVKATLSLDARARASRLLEDGFFDENGNRVGESFFDIISGLGGNKSIKFEDFGNYLAYVHALEWLAPNKTDGMKTSSGLDIHPASEKKVFADETLNDVPTLRDLIKSMEKNYPDFKDIARRLYKYQDNLMEYYLIPSGALNRDQADTFRAQYPHYVPFNRFNTAYGDATQKGRKASALFSNLKNVIKTAEGGTSTIRNPLESIINSTVAAVDLAMKNDVMLQLINEFTGSGSMPGVMERVYSQKELDRLNEKNENPFIVEEAFSKEDVNKSVQSTYTPVIDKEKGIVYAWVNGQKQFYQVYNRELYNAVANLEVKEFNKILKVINTLSNSMKKLITQLNPLFSAGNFYRDFQTFHYQSSANPNILKQLAMYAGALKSIIQQDSDYQIYRALGGMDSTKFKADMDAIGKAIKRNSKDMENKFVKVMKAVKFITWDAFWKLNDVAETLPRLAEFKHTMKTTGDVQLSMYRSHDVTTNFARSGTAGRHLNAIFLYSNASLQGLDKMVRNFTEAGYTVKEKSAKAFKTAVARKMLSYVGWSLILTAIQEFLNRRDEEAEEEYRRLSDFMKNNYDVFYIGDGKFFKLPKEQNNAIFRSVVQRTIDAISGDGIDMRELGSYIWSGLMPNFMPDVFDIENTLSGLGNNTVFGAFTDVATNRDFKGSEIVPSYMKGPDFEKYTANTSSFSVNLAKTLYKVTGMDISPMSIDHVIKGYGGYYGGLFVNLFPNIDVEERGVIGSAVKNIADAFGLKSKFIADGRYSTDILSDFYDGRDKSEKELALNNTGTNKVNYARYLATSNFITGFNKISATGSEKQQRLDRQMLLDLLLGFNDRELTEGEIYLANVYDETQDEDVIKLNFPSNELKSKTFTENGKKYVITASLGANEYAQFCADISNARESALVFIKGLGLSEEEAAVVISDTFKSIDDEYELKYLDLYGSKQEVSKEEVTLSDSEREAYKKSVLGNVTEKNSGDYLSEYFGRNIDYFGRDSKYASYSEKEAVENGYYTVEEYDFVESSLNELMKDNNVDNLYPTIQSNYYTKDGIKYEMTPEQHEEAQTIRGKRSFELLLKFFSGKKVPGVKLYSRCKDDADVIDAVKDIYRSAGDYTKDIMFDKVKANKK